MGLLIVLVAFSSADGFRKVCSTCTCCRSTMNPKSLAFIAVA